MDSSNLDQAFEEFSKKADSDMYKISKLKLIEQGYEVELTPEEVEKYYFIKDRAISYEEADTIEFKTPEEYEAYQEYLKEFKDGK